MFLIKNDFIPYIQELDLDTITDADDSLISQAVLSAVDNMKSYLYPRYDVVKVFIDVLTFDIGAVYVIGQLASYNDELYYCISDSSGNLPTDTNFFTKGDNRNQLIKMYAIDISLYDLHSRICPRNIPEIRFIRYQEAMNWLKMVKNSETSIDLPLYPIDDEGDSQSDGIDLKSDDAKKWDY